MNERSLLKGFRQNRTEAGEIAGFIEIRQRHAVAKKMNEEGEGDHGPESPEILAEDVEGGVHAAVLSFGVRLMPEYTRKISRRVMGKGLTVASPKTRCTSASAASVKAEWISWATVLAGRSSFSHPGGSRSGTRAATSGPTISSRRNRVWSELIGSARISLPSRRMPTQSARSEEHTS